MNKHIIICCGLKVEAVLLSWLSALLGRLQLLACSTSRYPVWVRPLLGLKVQYVEYFFGKPHFKEVHPGLEVRWTFVNPPLTNLYISPPSFYLHIFSTDGFRLQTFGMTDISMTTKWKNLKRKKASRTALWRNRSYQQQWTDMPMCSDSRAEGKVFTDTSRGAINKDVSTSKNTGQQNQRFHVTCHAAPPYL